MHDVQSHLIPAKLEKRVASLSNTWSDSNVHAGNLDATSESRISLSMQNSEGSTQNRLAGYNRLCSILSPKLKASAGAVFDEKYVQTLIYLSGGFGLHQPFLKGLQEDYDGILALTHQKKVLVYYSNKALSKIDLP